MADKRIQLTVGGRFQQVNSENFNVVTGAPTSSYGQNALSPAVAVLVKPRENVSVYANYIQGLEQGDTVGPNFANAGTVFLPYKTTQYEAGVKVDWGKLTTTVSLFQITPRRMLPDWTRIDLGFRYAFDNPAASGRPLVARFNVENVFDNDYWASGSSGVLALGAPRTFRLALTADFRTRITGPRTDALPARPLAAVARPDRPVLYLVLHSLREDE